MPIAARLEQFPAPDRRSAERRKLRLGSSLEATGEHVLIHDISPGGMLIETSAALAPFDALELELPNNGPTRALIIWNSGRYYGCAFSEPISKATVSAALLRSAPATESAPTPTRRGPSPRRRKDSPAARAVANTPIHDSTYEEKWSLGASTRFMLASAILLWALIIGAVIGITKLIEGAWR
jgi:hypothetical protein